ncbi:MAG: hypothetical protein KA384_07955 [Leptotrichiaceae bacterium]|nr:hypothetical protein [Leptotrichiaceae bacterium]
MTLKTLKQRLQNLKDTKFCYSLAENEINSLYAIILYYMALETNIDTGHTRRLWVQAINRISNVLTQIIPLPNYEIWKSYVFSNSLNESDSITVSYGSFGIKVYSDDEVWRSENKKVARNGNYESEINSLLEFRKSQYKGILGDDYVNFYVDKLLSEISFVLNGGKNSSLYPISIILRNYTKRIKEYIEKGR